jgi:hypothetical protein
MIRLADQGGRRSLSRPFHLDLAMKPRYLLLPLLAFAWFPRGVPEAAPSPHSGAKNASTIYVTIEVRAMGSRRR